MEQEKEGGGEEGGDGNGRLPVRLVAESAVGGVFEDDDDDSGAACSSTASLCAVPAAVASAAAFARAAFPARRRAQRPRGTACFVSTGGDLVSDDDKVFIFEGDSVSIVGFSSSGARVMLLLTIENNFPRDILTEIA